MKSVSLRIDGTMVLALLAIVAGVYVYRKKDEIANKINPSHKDNLINQGANAVFGKENKQGFFDHVFAAADLVNPFNKSDAFAKQVWGLD